MGAVGAELGNCEAEIDRISAFIGKRVSAADATGVVVNMSGGLDSTVTAALADALELPRFAGDAGFEGDEADRETVERLLARHDRTAHKRNPAPMPDRPPRRR